MGVSMNRSVRPQNVFSNIPTWKRLKMNAIEFFIEKVMMDFDGNGMFDRFFLKL